MVNSGWRTESLGNIATLQRGFDLPYRLRKPGLIPIVTSSGIEDTHCEAKVKGPGVVTGRYGTIGEVFFVLNDFWPLNTTLYVRDFHGNNPLFISYMLRTINFHMHSGKSGVPGVNRNDLHEITVALPSTDIEQETIAEALSDMDALIESVEQLIAKKRRIKQGVMQELLSGKKRLPGFSGEWQTCQVGELITHCSSGATPYRGRPDYYRGTVKWITSGELNYKVITDTIEHISEDAVQKTNLKVHPPGTFLMAITGLEAAGTRGACGIVGSSATTNQSCMAIYPSPKLTSEYLYHYYVFRGNELAFQYCQGTKQQSYTAKLVRLLPIDLPPKVEEQTAIAAILSDMDAEIAALEAKLAKARQVKQGMMQELLTGRIRLV